MTSKAGEATYAWDFENRLTSAMMSVGSVGAHVYDADGNRVKTSVTPIGETAAVTNMLVDTAGCASCGSGLSQVVADTDGSGNLTALYVRNGDEVLAVMRPAAGNTWTTRFVHGDGLGSVRALTDETGTTVDSRAYEAFGTKNVEAGNDALAYGFAGEPFEGTSMLAYHRARWMDARTGRFEGMDPFAGILESPQTLHRYLYVAGDPTDLEDASGLISPKALIVGQAVHKAIGDDWENGVVSTPLHDRVSDKSINFLTGGGSITLHSNWVLKLYFGVGGLGRPDLAAMQEHKIYEIKSDDEYAQGAAKLAAYLNLLRELDPASDWQPGGDDEYTPRGQLNFTNSVIGDYIIDVEPPVNGVITYVWNQGEKELNAALKGIGAVGAIDTSVSSFAAVGAGFL